MNCLKIIVFSGLPGSGKSTLAEAIAKELHSSIFSVDPIESSIIKSGIKKSFETGYAAYLVAETLAAEQLKLEMSVIIDAVNWVQEARNMWQELSKKYHTELFIIECVLDPQLHKERLEKRMRNLYGIPEITWESVEQRRKDYTPWNEERLIIDTSLPHEENIKKILQFIHS